MRYLLCILAMFFLSVNIYAQQLWLDAGTEKFHILDTSSYFNRQPLEITKDSLSHLLQLAEDNGDEELALSVTLFRYIKEQRDRVVSSDTTEYRLQRMINTARDKKLKRPEADALQKAAEFYSQKRQLSASLEYYTLAYLIYKEYSPAQFPARQRYAYRLGLAYYQYEDYRMALTYLMEGLKFGPDKGADLHLPIVNTIGLAYRNIGMYDSAIHYFQQIYDRSVRRDEKVWSGIAQGNIGITYFLQKKYKEAEPLLLVDIANSTEQTSLKNSVKSMTILGIIYYEQGRYVEAEQILKRALSICYERDFWNDYSIAEKIYQQLYRVYREQHQFSLSYLYADSALMAKDSNLAKQHAIAVLNADDKQNFIKKKLADERKRNDKKLNELKRLDQQQLLYKVVIGFLLVVLILVVAVNRFRFKLKDISTNKSDAPQTVVQKMSIVIISIATTAAAVVWGLLYYFYYGLSPATFGPIIYFLVIVPALIYYFIYKNERLLVNVQLFCIFVCPALIQLTNGGFSSGVVIMWSFLAPVGALMYKGIRAAAYWMAMFILVIVCAIIFNDYLSQYYKPISETAQYMFYGMDILGPGIVIYFTMQYFVKSIIREGELLQKSNTTLSKTLEELQHEKQKSDNLLLNILPEEVAEELKLKGKTAARHYDHVTVLFTDFVSFTAGGQRMSPQVLIDELNTCFKAFDEITGKYNIEKIKTVGDAYLAVAGLPTEDPLHAENVVRAAIEIGAFMKERVGKLGDKTFDIRIGIHSGSVVAGVVGIKKFAYDIWGDTVNTAARMEQNSEPGRINISASTFELVKDKFSFEYRGDIEAKGKGALQMYYVVDNE